jgi:hypothetical protein
MRIDVRLWAESLLQPLTDQLNTTRPGGSARDLLWNDRVAVQATTPDIVPWRETRRCHRPDASSSRPSFS